MKLNLKKLAAVLAFSASLFLPAAAFADGEPGGPNFDGKVYFVWECNGGKACYHFFDDFVSIDAGVNRRNYTEITDQSNNGVNYVFKQKNADWVLPDEFAKIKSNNYEDYIGDEDKQTHGVTIERIAFGDGVNSISSNENMMFKVIIYREGYKAVTVGDNANDYTYFPSEWDPATNPHSTFNSEIDISGTTADKPARVDTYLKEPTVKIKAPGIATVTPLNVNSGAVSYVLGMDSVDVTFHSSYYDHVVFELKFNDGKTYYLMIARTAITVSNDFFPDRPHVFSTQVMYPTGSADGNTYSVVATVVGKDGSKKFHTLKSEDRVITDDVRGTSENLGKSYPCGKGLSCSQFSITVGNIRQIEGVYVNVIKNSASIADVYPGTFSGSNKGTYWSSEARKVIYE